ncbi:MAG: M48 family metallopeptidase [Actinomycetota bacterium]|nr:M48 family metallopeptidase [Actinomycetota bacterium]
MNTFEPTNFFEQIRSNHRRSMVLMAATFVILYLFANLIVAAFGGYQRDAACTSVSASSCGTDWFWNPIALGVTAAAVGGYLWVAYLSSARAALAITKARPADGPEFQQLRNLVEGLSIASGLPVPAVYVVDDPAPNAFATGLKPEKAAIAVTTGLLATMSRRELEGVLAHELGHIRNRDTSFMTLVVLTVGAIMVLSSMLVRIGYYATLFSGGNRRSNREGGDSAAMIGLAMLAVGMIGFVIAVPSAMLLKAALSRRREVMADATAVELTRYPTGIRSALEKLEADTTVVKAMSTTTAHLWIESPLERTKGSGFMGGVGRLFDTHPPLAERIAVLRRYEGLDPNGRGPVDQSPGVLSPGGFGPRAPLPPPTGRPLN